MSCEPNIEVIIEELLLQGFAPSDGPRIASAVQRELTRLFAERGVPPTLPRAAEIPYHHAESFDVSPQSGHEAVGLQVARALYGGFQP